MTDVLSESIVREQLPQSIRFDSRRFTERQEYRSVSEMGGEHYVYELDMAPIQKLHSVSAVIDETRTDLTIGTDVTTTTTDPSLSEPDAITFADGDLAHDSTHTTDIDVGTDLIITYTAASVADRYVGAYEDEFTDVNDRVESVVRSHDVQTATGTDLDSIGSLFGLIGRRRGRSDDEYRTLLTSLVQSFKGRGTVSGIQFAVAAGLDIDPAAVSVQERFSDNSYTLAIDQYLGDTRIIGQLAELADPSGVSYRNRIDYTAGISQIGIQGEPLVATRANAVSLGDTTLGQETIGGKSETNIYK